MEICIANPQHEISSDFLLTNADMALYEAKSCSRNCIKEKEFKVLDAELVSGS